MSVTLVEAAQRALASGDVIRGSVIEIFGKANALLGAMQFKNIAGNAWKYDVEDTLPGVAFRGVNESYSESTGVINPQTEHLVIAGGDLDVDVFIVRTEGAGRRSEQEAMKAKKLAHTIGHKFIKGDSTSDPREFDGLQVRLTGGQLIENGNTSGGDPLSLLKLDEAIDAVDSPTHLLMNKVLRRRLTVAARTTTVGGFITYDVDAFGQRVTKYNDLPILIADQNSDVFATLAFDEAGGGGGTTATSVYVLSIGDGMVMGLQNGDMDVRDMGELQTASVFRTRVEWFVAMSVEHPRAAARLRGISNAAVVA